MKKQTWKKTFCAAAALMMSASLLAACGKDNGKTSGVAKPDKDGKVTLTITDWETENLNNAMQKAFDEEFSKEHPNIKVKIQPAPLGDYAVKLSQMISSGTAPDIFQFGDTDGYSFTQRGLLYDWKEYFEKDKAIVDDMYPGIMDTWIMEDGTVTGLPALLNVLGIFYNKDLLAEAGLDEPKNGWTYEEMFSYAEKLKGADGEYGVYGLNMNFVWTNVLSVGNGGQVYKDDILNPTKFTWDDKFYEAIEMFQEHIASGAVTPPTYETTNIQDVFKQGQIPMLQYGQWLISDLINNPNENLNWGYVSNPMGSEKITTEGGGSIGWMSPKQIKAPDEIWELMKFMATDMYTSALKVSPVAACASKTPSESFFNTVIDAGHPEAAEAVDYMMNVETKISHIYPSWKPEVEKEINSVWNDVLMGKKDISELKAVEEKVNQIIADSNK